MIEPGMSYVTKNKIFSTYKAFIQELEKGRQGLIISKTRPEVLEKRYSFNGNYDIQWMTDKKHEKRVKLWNEAVSGEILDFLKEYNNGIIIFDGFRKLSQYDFRSSYYKFLNVKDNIAISEASMLIPINTKEFSEEELRELDREFDYKLNL
jgi:hypothetical protein